MRKTTSNQYSSDKEVAQDPRFHDTWKLLSNYRDVVWSLELSIQQVRQKFSMEYGTSIEDFLDSVYMAGADLSGTEIEYQARCIDRTNKMLNLLKAAVETLRTKHKFGETYYWVLYYTYLSPQELPTVVDVIEALREHIEAISYRTYYRLRKEAIKALSSVLWGYTSKDCLEIIEQFFPENNGG